MFLVFKGGTETVTLELDRKIKLLYVTSAKTNNVRVKTEWINLFDKGKEDLQEKITDQLSDKMFIEAIKNSMALNGYQLVYSKC